VVLLGAGTVMPAPSPAARAATPTKLTSLSFSWTGGLLQRTQVQYVTVSLTLVDPDGIAPLGVTWGDVGIASCPCIVINQTAGGEPNSRHTRLVRLHLTSGTTTSGVWSGRFALGAADAGFWRPYVMAAGDIIAHDPTLPPEYDETMGPVPAPWNHPTINLRGYNWPRAWLGTPVKTGSMFTLHGGVYFSRSGAPVAGMRLEIKRYCRDPTPFGSPYIAVRTSSAGLYSYQVSPAVSGSDDAICSAHVAYPTDAVDSFVVQSNIRKRG
jgi:hypothetical protein